MTKNELIAAVADTAKLTKTSAASAVDATFDIITGALKRGDEVKLIGFGSFKVVKRAGARRAQPAHRRGGADPGVEGAEILSRQRLEGLGQYLTRSHPN